MTTQILLLLVLVIAVVYIFHTRKNAKQKSQPPYKKTGKATNAKPIRSAHRCVVIEPGLLSCKAIAAYEGKHILIDEAPVLPVSGCNTEQCDCKFLRYDDRRMGTRRGKVKAADHIISASNNNKRSKKERRNTTG